MQIIHPWCGVYSTWCLGGRGYSLLMVIKNSRSIVYRFCFLWEGWFVCLFKSHFTSPTFLDNFVVFKNISFKEG